MVLSDVVAEGGAETLHIIEEAGAALWLCSDAASFVTGHAMAVDGGLVAR